VDVLRVQGGVLVLAGAGDASNTSPPAPHASSDCELNTSPLNPGVEVLS
jgi:hypothetical protein